MQTSLSAISGHDFVRTISSHFSKDPVEGLLRSCKDSECDYLELKRTIEVTQDHCGKGESPEDIYWNIAKSIIAMINSRGGVLLIGVDDKDHSKYGIAELSADAKKYIEENSFQDYCERKIEAHLFPSTLKWQYKGNTYEVSEQIKNYVTAETLECGNKARNVRAYFVRPCENNNFLTVKTTYTKLNKEGPEILYFRHLGEEGKCGQLKPIKEIISYIENRSIKDSELSVRLEKILKTDYGIKLEILPIRNNRFVGRKRELESIENKLKEGKIPVIHGEGGSGKSELAYEFAHRHESVFSGGCLYLDMANEENWESAVITLYNKSEYDSQAKVIRNIVGNSIPKECENNKAQYICGKILDNLEKTQGKMLVILDDIKTIKRLSEKSLSNMMFSKHLGKSIYIIATTRVTDYTPINEDSVELISLGRLDSDAAAELILKHINPSIVENNKNEYNAVKRIVELLGCNAWGIEITGSYLSQNIDCVGDPPLSSYLQTMELDGWRIDDDIETFRNKEKTVSKLLEPTILALKRNRKKGGEKALYLAQCIAMFPHAGVNENPLMLLWEKKFHPKDNVNFKGALKLLEDYSIINKKSNDNYSSNYKRRMHHLTQEFFREYVKKNKKNLANEISNILAKDPNCPFNYWVELAQEDILMAYCPWKKLDVESCRNIILCNPEKFADKIDWRRLDSYTIAEVLSTHPDLKKYLKSYDILYHNDSERSYCAFAVLLSRASNSFAEHCDFSKLSDKDILFILINQPSLAKRCLTKLNKFTIRQWISLLSECPSFFKKCGIPELESSISWNEFEYSHWVRLLAKEPGYKKMFDNQGKKLKELTTFKWSWLIAHHPDKFITEECPIGEIAKQSRALAVILIKQPQLIERNEFKDSLCKLQPSQWIEILSANPNHPSLRRHFQNISWNVFSGSDWAKLLSKQPDLSTYCDFSKLDGNDWGDLLLYQPQFARNEAWKKIENTDPKNNFFSPLIRVLYHHPELIENREYNFSKLTNAGKRMLLSKAPKLRKNIPSKELPAEDWARLVMMNPDFGEDNRFKELNPIELAVIMHCQSHLQEKIKKDITNEKFQHAISISKEKNLVLSLIDILWHYDDARMIRDEHKLVNVANTLSWIYFVLGLKKQAERYKKIVSSPKDHITKNNNYRVPAFTHTVKYVDTMVDIVPETIEEDYNKALEQIKKNTAKSVCVLIHKFSQTNNAEKILALLKKCVKQHRIKMTFIDINNTNIEKMTSKIKNQNEDIILLNFLERYHKKFPDKNKSERVRKFHESAQDLACNERCRRCYHKAISISPLYFSKPNDHAGELLLAEILRT